MRVELPGEAWAELRDAAQVKNRAAREVRRALAGVEPETRDFFAWMETLKARGDEPLTEEEQRRRLTGEQAAQMWRVNDAVTLSLVREWSFVDDNGQPLPISMESLEELPAPAYERLTAITAEIDVIPRFNVDPDPQSPTGPSSE